VTTEDDMPQDQREPTDSSDTGLSSTVKPADHFDDLTRAFIRLNNVPTCPLDRLSRYEASVSSAANHGKGDGYLERVGSSSKAVSVAG
jgi:hypothetical protein